VRPIFDPIHPAAVSTAVGTDAKSEPVRDERAAKGRPEFVARIAVLRARRFGAHVHAVLVQAWGRLDEPHSPPFGARAEQGALRSAQHLDPVYIEERRK